MRHVKKNKNRCKMPAVGTTILPWGGRSKKLNVNYHSAKKLNEIAASDFWFDSPLLDKVSRRESSLDCESEVV